MTSPPSNAKLIWISRCGMLELDLILSRFITRHINELTDAQRYAYEHLLTHPDPDLLNWLMGYEVPTDPRCIDIVEFIRNNDHF